MDDIIRELRESATLKVHVAETQGAIIQAMIECIWESMQQGGKLLICGNGGSAADAQHLATECMVRLEAERAPASDRTDNGHIVADCGNDYGFETIFARQVAGARPSGRRPHGDQYKWHSPNVVRAVEEAHRRGLHTLGLLLETVEDSRIWCILVVPSSNTQRIQEVHITIGHILWPWSVVFSAPPDAISRPCVHGYDHIGIL